MRSALTSGDLTAGAPPRPPPAGGAAGCCASRSGVSASAAAIVEAAVRESDRVEAMWMSFAQILPHHTRQHNARRLVFNVDAL